LRDKYRHKKSFLCKRLIFLTFVLHFKHSTSDMKKLFLILPLFALLYACGDMGSGNGGTTSLATPQDSAAYAFGYSLVKDLSQPGLEMNAKLFETGYEEGSSENPPLSEQQAIQTIRSFIQELGPRQGRPITAEDPIQANIDSVSYAYGVYFGSQFTSMDANVNGDALVAGYAAAATNDASFPAEKVAPYRQKFEQELQALAQAAAAKKAGANKVAGQQFLAENKSKEGIMELEGGMQYKVLKEGSGTSPQLSDQVVVHYEGRLLSGEVFDSSYERGEPITFPLGNLILGWQKALVNMKPGGKWQLFIPSDMAYGDQGTPNIPPGSTLIFDVELLGIADPEAGQ
jgi:FKBP-type peptidyl-prolyl cis-trans isomerase